MLLLIDKPKGITSHDVVDRVRRITGERRVGHAGTLDPNATGLLIVGVGRESTKKLGEIAKGTTKTYQADIFLGEERDTDDVLGKIRKTKYKKAVTIDQEQIKKVLKNFIGNKTQTPPAFSAIKIKGKKAYELARKGKKVNLKPRKIVIYSINLIDYRFPIIGIEVKVSSGTYVRALARDIGRKLGCGAYLDNLHRTAIGQYSLKEASSFKELANLYSRK